MAVEIVANLLAGLGLFFIGVKFIGEHMRQMAGRSLRRFVGFLTSHPLASLLSGLVSGALVQSATAVTFIMTSLISSRLITVRKAMPIITWANVGTSLIVLLAVLDLHLAALYILGAVGLCYYFDLDRSNRFRHSAGALFGLGMLLLGLIFMKAGAAPLKSIDWLAHFLTYTKSSYLLAFITGGFFTFIAQSATTVSVVAIAMARAGLLGTDQTVMIIYGSNLGSGLSTWFMSSNLKGTARQLAIFQATLKTAGAVVLVPLFYAEVYLHLPAVQALAARMAGDFGRQMTYVYLIFQLASAAAATLAAGPILRLIEKLSPATAEEELSRTQFIYEQALEEPETALDLVEQELLRLVQHLPDFLDAARAETASRVTVGSGTLRKAVNSVATEVRAFTTDLIDQHQSRESLECALNLQNRLETVVSLANTLDDLVTGAQLAAESQKLSAFTQRLSEALHLILMTAHEASEFPTEENRGALLQLTADRGEMMAQIRRSFLAERSLSPAHQQILMSITTHFERTIWLLRRFGMLLADAALSGTRGTN